MDLPIICRADLEAEIASLEGQRQAKAADLARIDGALLLARHLLGKIERRAAPREEPPAESAAEPAANGPAAE